MHKLANASHEEDQCMQLDPYKWKGHFDDSQPSKPRHIEAVSYGTKIHPWKIRAKLPMVFM